MGGFFRLGAAWLASVPFPVVVSEYTAPRGCVEVASRPRRATVSATDNSTVYIERLFVQERFADRFSDLTGGVS